MFCFELKIGGGGSPLDSEILGAGGSLFEFFGFPVRYVSSRNGQGMLWANLNGYPWSETFLSDVRNAISTTNWNFEISRCT